MKKTILGLLVGLAFVFSASAANAQILEIYGEYPLSYSFSEGGSADGVSGLSVGVRSFVLPVGLGVDQYTIDAGSGAEYEVNFYNIFYASPFPIIQLTVGVGLGGASYDATTSAVYKDADLFQWYFGAGWSIMPLLGIYVGVHNVSGSGDAKTATDPDLELSGRMTSFGIRFGF